MSDPWWYDYDMYDIIHPDQQYEKEEVVICTCYGRGKTMEELVLPRLPMANVMQEKMNQLIAAANTYRRTRGKGRGLLRSQPNITHVGKMMNAALVNDTMSTISQAGSLSSSISSLDQIDISSNARNNEQPCSDPGTSNMKVSGTKPWGSWRFEDKVETGYGVIENEYAEYRPPQRKTTTLEAFIPQTSPAKKKKKKKNGRNHANSENIGTSFVEEKPDVKNCSQSQEYVLSITPVNNELKLPGETLMAAEETLPQQAQADLPQQAQADIAQNCDSIEGEESVVTSGCSGSKEWTLHGPCVVQMNHLPPDCDISVLQDIVSSYGMMKNSQVMNLDDSMSVRFQLDSSETCDWVVECLHNTEGFFPDSPNRPLECIRVDKDS